MPCQRSASGPSNEQILARPSMLSVTSHLSAYKAGCAARRAPWDRDSTFATLATTTAAASALPYAAARAPVPGCWSLPHGLQRQIAPRHRDAAIGSAMSIRAEEALVAPWWPELVEVKDTLTYAQLARRFPLPTHVLIRSLALAGLSKAPMPRGRKAAGSGLLAPDAPAVRAEPAAPVGEATGPDWLPREVGRRPDAEVAALAGVTLDEVKFYRRKHGIAPFLRPPPSFADLATKPEHGAVAPSAAAATKADGLAAVAVRRRTDGEGAVAEVTRRLPTVARSHATVPVGPPTPPSPAPPTTASVLEPFFQEPLGVLADHGIAERAGVTAPVAGVPVLVANEAPSETDGTPLPDPIPGLRLTYYAFVITAVRGMETRRFYTIGLDLGDAVSRATAALSARADGPWRLRMVREGPEALTPPA